MTDHRELRGNPVLVRWPEAVPRYGRPRRTCALIRTEDATALAVYEPETNDETLELCDLADLAEGMRLLHSLVQSARAVQRAATRERRAWKGVRHFVMSREDSDGGEFQELDEAGRAYESLLTNFEKRYGHTGTKTEDLTR